MEPEPLPKVERPKEWPDPPLLDGLTVRTPLDEAFVLLHERIEQTIEARKDRNYEFTRPHL